MIAQLRGLSNGLGAATHPAADPDADDRSHIWQREQHIVRDACAEQELQPDSLDAHEAEEHRGEGRADGVRRAKGDSGEAHESAPCGHVLRKDGVRPPAARAMSRAVVGLVPTLRAANGCSPAAAKRRPKRVRRSSTAR